jgi:Protein of unknown function (DUF1203)
MRTTVNRLRYSIRPIPSDVADRIRQTLIDDFGNPLTVVATDSPAPCRHCLRIASAGERLIVFSYRPFSSIGPYAEVGPIFVHADACEAYDKPDQFPPDFVQRTLTMRGYNEHGTIETAELSVPGEPEASLERLLANERVRFVHVRNPAWGCYDFQVDRTQTLCDEVGPTL